MKVNELAAMLGTAVKIESIWAWNARGNTPSKGCSFKSANSLSDAYGEQEVMSWKLEGKCGGNYVTLDIRMYGTDM